MLSVYMMDMTHSGLLESFARRVRRITRTGIALLIAIVSGSAASAQNTTPTAVATPKSLASLHRANEEWVVQTSVCLSATDPDPIAVPPAPATSPKPGEFEFVIVGGRRTEHGVLACEAGCSRPPKASAETTNAPLSVPSAAQVRCIYQPDIGYTGNDHFQFTAKDAEGHVSTPATVDIVVRDKGLRWELLAGGSTGLTSDESSLNDLPDVLGSTNQDLLFALNWQTKKSHKKNETVGALKPDTERSLIQARQLQPPKPKGKHGTFNSNVLFKIGWLSDPAAVTAVNASSSVATPPPTPSASATSSNASPITAATQRHFTSATQANFNWVGFADSEGTFFEFGAAGRAAIDVYPAEADQARTVNGTFVQLVNKGQTTIRAELGVRFALKQYRENAQSIALHDDDVVQLDNIDDMIVVEAGFQHNGAMTGLTGLPAEFSGADTGKRLVIRAQATLPFGNLPASAAPTIGIELSKAWVEVGKVAGPWTTKIIYGVDLSGSPLSWLGRH